MCWHDIQISESTYIVIKRELSRRVDKTMRAAPVPRINLCKIRPGRSIPDAYEWLPPLSAEGISRQRASLLEAGRELTAVTIVNSS